MNTQNVWEGVKSDIRKSKTLIFWIIAIILILAIFQLGVFVGYRKASFSYNGGERYYRMFEGSRKGAPLMDTHFSASHGATGRVVSVALPSFIVAGPDNFEKTVVIGDKTIVRKFRDTVTASSIEPDSFVVVLGTPNQDGSIQARLIRLVPPSIPFTK